MTQPTAYPLAWPAHRPRSKNRRAGSFRHSDAASGYSKPVSVTQAIRRLDDETRRLGAQYPIISSNLRRRLDGSPVLNEGAPADPGVCCYFTLKGKPFALACDTFLEVAQNIAAIAAHIDATRRIERYGVASAAETLQAFAALPAPGAAAPVARPWWKVLGLSSENDLAGYQPTFARALIQTAYAELAKTAHPDRGGTDSMMAELNRARDEAFKAIAQANALT